MRQLTVRTGCELLALGVIALVIGVGAASSGADSRSLIAIHEQGENLQEDQVIGHCPCGKYTVDLRGARFGPAGTSRIFPDPSARRNVRGQEQQLLAGTDALTSKAGQLVLAFAGTQVTLNGRLSPSGEVVGPAVEYGTWKVKTATGSYRGWKGGGSWAAAFYGYGRVQPYSVEWDGYLTP